MNNIVKDFSKISMDQTIKFDEILMSNKYTNIELLIKINKTYNMIQRLKDFIEEYSFWNCIDLRFKYFILNATDIEILTTLNKEYNIIQRLKKDIDFNEIIEEIYDSNNKNYSHSCCMTYPKIICIDKNHEKLMLFSCSHNKFYECKYCDSKYCSVCIENSIASNKLLCHLCLNFTCSKCIECDEYNKHQEHNPCDCGLTDKKMYKKLLKNLNNNIYSDEEMDLDYEPSVLGTDEDDSEYDSGTSSSDPSYEEFFE